jgi:1,4-dihydroxy-2-naphthoyl-CoA hydrolase
VNITLKMDRLGIFKNISVEHLNELGRGTMIEHVGIEIIEIGKDYLKGRMPVDKRTIQIYGILHGGASAVLVETLGSFAGMLTLDAENEYCVGVEINASHIRSASSGYVYGTATPLHVGRRTQVWEIRIHNEEGQLTCVGRLTLAILHRNRKGT